MDWVTLVSEPWRDVKLQDTVVNHDTAASCLTIYLVPFNQITAVKSRDLKCWLLIGGNLIVKPVAMF